TEYALQMIHQYFYGQRSDLFSASGIYYRETFSYKHDKDGEGFALTLDTKDFSPEELSVKQVGRKLKVSGKTEKKLDDGEGSYSYRCQEFRQEFDLPEEVNPETVTCSLAHDGKLHIQAPKNPLSCEDEVAERVVPINLTSPLPCSVSPSGELWK
uniref:SHSP domain-containing protein n=1 Tax=Oncorhynchus mykiss TaxID=8022 RepID=A0A8C7UGU9_ONCMY